MGGKPSASLFMSNLRGIVVYTRRRRKGNRKSARHLAKWRNGCLDGLSCRNVAKPWVSEAFLKLASKSRRWRPAINHLKWALDCMLRLKRSLWSDKIIPSISKARAAAVLQPKCNSSAQVGGWCVCVCIRRLGKPQGLKNCNLRKAEP